jgi:hypothetical protein
MRRIVWDLDSYKKHIMRKLPDYVQKENLTEEQVNALQQIFASAISIANSNFPEQMRLALLWSFLVGCMMFSVYLSRFNVLDTITLTDFVQFCIEEIYMDPEKTG